MKEPQALKQIHKIREKIHKKTKHLSDSGFIAYIRENSKRYLKDFQAKSSKKRKKAS